MNSCEECADDDHESECSICMMPLENDGTTLIDCGHTFHASCIIKWFRSGNSACPLCRGTPTVRIEIPTVMQRASTLMHSHNTDKELKKRIDRVNMLTESLIATRQELRKSERDTRIAHQQTIDELKQKRIREKQRHANNMSILDRQLESIHQLVSKDNDDIRAKLRIVVRSLNKAKRELGFYGSRPVITTG